ncbi:hypothetical protein O181_081527 [Austropuccinia psidii MF-1]|uniref:Uncharacterized protein n=1 Tax=Austropuccinia psidii MF-1 TaxID=1389203 RepID=A0A9Q3IIF1_9BASI|nr:hypothetical protein [Austropuccinia psidii MF-1]
MPQPLPRTPGNSTEFNELQTSAPESGSEISDMVSSHELGIEVESLAHETQPPSSHKTNFKSYEKEKTVEPCAPTEDAGQDDVIFSGEVKIISKEQFVSNISQTIPRLEIIQNDSKIPDYVHQKIAESMSLLNMDLNCVEVGESLPEGSQVVIGVSGKGLGKRPNINATKNTNKKRRTFEAAKDAWDQGDEMINVEVDHIDTEPPHNESPPILNEKIHDETPPPLLKIFKLFKKGRQFNMIHWDKILLI